MNEIQLDSWRELQDAKSRVRIIEAQLSLVKAEVRVAERNLQKAINADRKSWHDTPGILK